MIRYSKYNLISHLRIYAQFVKVFLDVNTHFFFQLKTNDGRSDIVFSGISSFVFHPTCTFGSCQWSTFIWKSSGTSIESPRGLFQLPENIWYKNEDCLLVIFFKAQYSIAVQIKRMKWHDIYIFRLLFEFKYISLANKFTHIFLFWSLVSIAVFWLVKIHLKQFYCFWWMLYCT